MSVKSQSRVGTTKVRLSSADRRRQVIEVATEMFAREGFRGATTREIAKRAGVNEAILFRHFPAKEDLCWAVIEEKCLERGVAQRVNDRLAAGGDDRKIFAGIAEEILRTVTEDTSLTRLLLFSALSHHRLAHRFFRTHISVHYDVMAAYIRRRTKEGVFRRVDPLLAARGFLGMVIYHIWIQELFGGKRYQPFDLKRVSRTLSEIWIQGMRAVK